MNNSRKTVVFADLDESFLNDKYHYGMIKPILDKLLLMGVAVVFCSCKTRAEIEFYQRMLGVRDPFASENGSAVFIPKGYFHSCPWTRRTWQYEIIELGLSYRIIRRRLRIIQARTGASILGFGDMTADELAVDSGLPLWLAKLAKQREYDEPFRVLVGNEERIAYAIKKQHLACTPGGRYLHLLGDTSKGQAVAVLKGLFRRKFGSIVTFGIGDNPSDMSMLEEVDHPFLAESSRGGIQAAWRGILKLASQKRELFSGTVCIC